MFNRLIPILFAVIFIASSSLIGCSQLPANNSEVSSSRSMQTSMVKSGDPTSSSSLELMRQGELSAPLSSPLRDVYYDFDRYNLSPDGREILKANASWLKANPLVRVEIEGHADERGTNEYNLALGANRAQSSKDYLLSLGISEGRLTTMSYGEEVPVCKERSEGCWQKNRRARFVIIPAQPAYSSSPATFQAAAK